MNVKLNFTLEGLWRPRGGVEVLLYSFFKLGTRWVWVVDATPWPLYPQNVPCAMCRRLGGPHYQSEHVRKNSPPNGIRSSDRTDRNSGYTDLAISANQLCSTIQGPPKKCIHTLTKGNCTLYNRLL